MAHGCVRYATTVLGSTLAIRSRFLGFSSGYTQTTLIAAPALAWRSAAGSSSVSAGAFGWGLHSEQDLPSTSPCPLSRMDSVGQDLSKKILLVEDNAADISLLREAFSMHGIHNVLIVVRDGEAAIQFLDALAAHGEVCVGLVILDLNL